MFLKKVKLIISFFIIAVCLTLNGEFYASYLHTFEDDYASFTFKDGSSFAEKKEHILNGLDRLCAQENAGVFIRQRVKQSEFRTELVIYANQAASDWLKSKDIDSGVHKSLFSGSTDIQIKELSEAAENDYSSRIWLTGDSQAVRRVYDTVSKEFELTALTGYTRNDKTRNLVILWIIASAAVLLFTAFDIVFQKKECFVRITMGTSVWRIIGSNILLDSAVLICGFLLLSAVLSRFVYIRYKYEIAIVVIIIIVILNSLIYLSMLSFTVKKALSGASASNGLLFLSYALRSSVIIALLGFLSVNLSSVGESVSFLSARSIVENFDGKSFLTLHYYPEVYDKDPAAMIKKTYSTEFDIIQGEYNGLDCAVDFLALDGKVKYLLVNDKASVVLDGIEGFDASSADSGKIYVLIPSSAQNVKEAILSESREVYEIYFDKASLPFEAVDYSGGDVLYYGNQTELHSAFAHDPIVIYFSEDLSQKKLDIEELQVCGLLEHLMLTADDETLKQLDEKYRLNENGMYLTAVSVNEDYEQYKDIIIKKIVILTSISGLMFVLGLLIIGVIIRIEYTVNSTELAIKKVLGYPLGLRYRRLFLIGRISYLAAIAVCIIVFKKNEIEISPMYMAAALMIMVVSELAVELRYIFKTEKAQAVKILKGGSL